MRLYISSILGLEDAASYDAASLRINPYRQEKLQRLQREADKKRCVLAGLLENYVFYHYREKADRDADTSWKQPEYDPGTPRKQPGHVFQPEGESLVQELFVKQLLSIPQQRFTLQRTDGGKPFFSGEEGLYYNLSHSGEYVLCGVADRSIGVDLQKADKPVRDALAKRVMTAEEYEAYLGIKAAQRQDFFYKRWTAKEAYAKWTGKGLSEEFCSLFADLPGARVISHITGKAATLHMETWKDTYYIGMCYEGKGEGKPL